MKNDTVDPAALLLAVVTIAVTVLTNEGPWDPMNTVLALVILTVLWGYALARRERRRTVSTTEGVAVGVVIGLASAIALAFPLQWWLSGVATSAPAKEGGGGQGPPASAPGHARRRDPPLVANAEHGPLTRGPVSRAPGAGRPRG